MLKNPSHQKVTLKKYWIVGSFVSRDLCKNCQTYVCGKYVNKLLISKFLIWSFVHIQQQEFKQPIFGLHISAMKGMLHSENYV